MRTRDMSPSDSGGCCGCCGCWSGCSFSSRVLSLWDASGEGMAADGVESANSVGGTFLSARLLSAAGSGTFIMIETHPPSGRH